MLAIWRLGLCPPGPSHHAELGPQLNFQALEHPPELIQLTVALLHQLAVKGRFFVQLLRLRQERTEGIECSRGPLAGKSSRRAEDPCPTLLRNQALASLQFLSAIILVTHLIQDAAQVYTGGGVHLHTDVPTNLILQMHLGPGKG